jgi:hypothetical protein
MHCRRGEGILPKHITEFKKEHWRDKITSAIAAAKINSWIQLRGERDTAAYIPNC